MPDTTPTAPDLIDPNGRTWHPTDRQRDGHTLYVIDGVEAATCPSIALSTRAELQRIFNAEMKPAPATGTCPDCGAPMDTPLPGSTKCPPCDHTERIDALGTAL